MRNKAEEETRREEELFLCKKGAAQKRTHDNSMASILLDSHFLALCDVLFFLHLGALTLSESFKITTHTIFIVLVGITVHRLLIRTRGRGVLEKEEGNIFGPA